MKHLRIQRIECQHYGCAGEAERVYDHKNETDKKLDRVVGYWCPTCRNGFKIDPTPYQTAESIALLKRIDKLVKITR